MTEKEEWLIVGLGNPGRKYELTKHNVGFWALDSISKKVDIAFTDNKFYSFFGKGMFSNLFITIIKPQTYMNQSGKAVKICMSSLNIDPLHLIVIHDDMDLAIGRVKIVTSRGSGGHKGVKSIIDNINTKEFARIRIGIGHPSDKHDIDPKEYVLSFFNKVEKQTINHIVQKTYEMVKTIIEDGIEIAMNQYNALCYQLHN